MLKLFSSYFEEASGCTFRSFCFYRLRLFCCACLCLLCLCVCVCVVSCRVVSSCVVSGRFLLLIFVVFHIFGEKTFFDCCRRDTSTNERDCPASQSTVAGLARQRLWITTFLLLCLLVIIKYNDISIIIRVRGSSNRLTNHPGGDVCRGLLMHAGLLFVVCCCRRRLTGSFWTNRAEAHGQLVLSPVRLPEQLRSSR